MSVESVKAAVADAIGKPVTKAAMTYAEGGRQESWIFTLADGRKVGVVTENGTAPALIAVAAAAAIDRPNLK